MALAFTLDTGFPVRMGLRRMSRGTIAFDNSYPTGGEAITAANLGFKVTVEEVLISGGQLGYCFEWDKTNSKLKVVMPVGAPRVLNPAEAARNLVAAAADVSTYHLTRAGYCVGFSSVVTTLTAIDTIAAVMSVEKRDPDGASNAVELATITYADADPVGTLDSFFTAGGATGGGATTANALDTPYVVPAGYTLVLKHKTQGTDSGAAAGAAKCHIWIQELMPNLELDNAADLSALTAVRFVAFGW